MRYRPRLIESELAELLTSLPAIAIEGAKAVGKTATASRHAESVHALDDPARMAVGMGDPRRLLRGEPPVLIDEWQRLPEVWDLVRRAVDPGAAPGSFLLTGSVTPDGAGTHSGAGRIPILRMRPLSLAERLDGPPSVSLARLLDGSRPELAGDTLISLEDYVDEILTSGFPGLRELPARAHRAQLDGYLARIIDRDFAELGHELRNPGALRRWMSAYAAASSSTTSFEKIRAAAAGGDGATPSRKAVIPYRHVLERLWILDPVPGWIPTRSHLSRLGVAEKHQLIDPALAARLVGATDVSLLEGGQVGHGGHRDGTFLGALFESLVTQSVRVYAQAAEAEVRHLRSHSGAHEVDLIVRRADDRVVALEVKLARTPVEDDLRHLKWLRERIGEDLLDAIVVTTGDAAYRRPDGIGVVPAALLGP